MGIYIPGMEMPDNCGDCNMPMEWCNKWIGVEVGKRSDDCPLIPIPPHGRLIDADAFEKHIKYYWFEYDRWIADEVENCPTVLEAEEGE